MISNNNLEQSVLYLEGEKKKNILEELKEIGFNDQEIQE